jgi:hypothetical protein
MIGPVSSAVMQQVRKAAAAAHQLDEHVNRSSTAQGGGSSVRGLLRGRSRRVVLVIFRSMNELEDFLDQCPIAPFIRVCRQ